MHFLTLVIGDDPDAQLEPFQANDSGEYPAGTPLEPFVVFISEEEEYRARYETGVFDSEHEKRWHPGRYAKPIREVFPTFANYMAEVFGEPDEKTGRYGRWWNPNAQFDWYVLGGRWRGHLILKPEYSGLIGGPCPFTGNGGPELDDQAQKIEIDFAAMGRERYAQLMADWDDLARRGKIADSRERMNHDIPESCRTRDEFEAYARRRSVHCAPSAVLYRGEWFGPWWLSDEPADVAAEKWDAWFSALLASLPDDTLLTVVDRHA